ncbi:MAG: UDP-N-acetylmuramoyl-tripeptide--D-alanyl-D-alanine ligase [uncultured Rubrobacteraceae bacterium]|uniref:UDP-N-acetylmuramoyl-tripeptide--D-alanyl-D-alanine ligase n=1 Tax=uncultured Rubrobacteraceae bacterium TaxID=349277 RepID=A0A6J4P7D4_9ACTN|nr:MAG: UDP-N-acetylmuramoyl-tripeptide--D-alanyl-D-alanine ligase [uncultured Rubrobacteraceae bacterium]
MRPAALREVALVLGAGLHGTDGGAEVRGAASDSRQVRGGDLFFAFQGRIDGAAFANEAFQRGAVATVATRPLDGPTLVVNDPMAALQDLARWSLRRPDVEAPAVVGITGSVGKTTTKDALSVVLRSAGVKVSATVGNLNNEIGLPLTVLAAGANTEVLVLEMGATHVGNVADLCAIASPRYGILTAIAPAHLDSFGSLKALAATKGELAASLPPEGSLVSPLGVPDVAVAPEKDLARRIVFSAKRAGGADLWASDFAEDEGGLRFVGHLGGRSVKIRSPVFGTHLVEPLLAAMGGALALGLDLEETARGISRLKRTGMRGDVYRLRDDVLVYDDSYNAASPPSMAAVLRYAAETAGRQGRRLVVVLGGMFELGAGSRTYHREIGTLANDLGVDLLACVGDEARWYAETFTGATLFYPDAAAAASGVSGALEPGDYLIVKGSRGVQLDTLTRQLKKSLALV